MNKSGREEILFLSQWIYWYVLIAASGITIGNQCGRSKILETRCKIRSSTLKKSARLCERTRLETLTTQNYYFTPCPACPTCLVKCELLVVARLFNRDEISFAFISSGLNFKEQLSAFNWGLPSGMQLGSFFLRGLNSKKNQNTL